MPSVGSLVLRFLGVFAVTLILSFFGLALAIGFLGVRIEGMLPWLSLLALAQLFGAISAGKLIGRTTGMVPGEMYTLRIAILTAAAALLAMALFLIQATRLEWLGGLPSLNDPEMRKSLLLGGAIFIAAAAILGRFGLIFGARAGRRQYTVIRPQIVVEEQPLEIYRSPHGYSHPQPSARFGRHETRQTPGITFALLWLVVLAAGGAIVLASIYAGLIAMEKPVTKQIQHLMTMIPALVPFLVGNIYGARASARIPYPTAYASAGLYSVLVTTGIFTWMVATNADPSFSSKVMQQDSLEVIGLVWLAITLIAALALRLGSRLSGRP